MLEGKGITFKNFTGRPDRYNKDGKRSFAIQLDEDEAHALAEQGWNVKFPKNDDGERRYSPTLQVAVNYSGQYPPIIYQVMGDRMVALNEDTVGALDAMTVAKVDVVINPSQWDVNGETGIKAYLHKLYATIEVDAFDAKYADLTSDDDLPFM